MKKYFVLILTLVFVATVGLVGCKKKEQAAQPAATPVVTPPPAPAPAPAPAPTKPAPAPAKPAKK